MVGMSSMRATGDTRLPSLLMIIASIANIAIDPIMIFGFGPIPAMGLKGAAMAALISRGAIFLGTIYFMSHRLNMLSYAKPTFSEMKRVEDPTLEKVARILLVITMRGDLK